MMAFTAANRRKFYQNQHENWDIAPQNAAADEHLFAAA
jgi:hypothetical protein